MLLRKRHFIMDKSKKNKTRYKITNWSEYNKSLVKRGSIILWIDNDLLCLPQSFLKRSRGRPFSYSDVLIQGILQLSLVYDLPLRATEGFFRSILSLMGKSDALSPHYSTLCKRRKTMDIPQIKAPKRNKDIIIAIDSTGLKLYGEGEWHVRKHGASKRRTWRKLHLAVDVDTSDIVVSTLTTNNIDDAAVVPSLLEQIKSNVSECSADGAYDKTKAREALYKYGIKQVIPPSINAVIQADNKKHNPALMQRDKAIETIEALGDDSLARELWKISENYHKRSLSENAMYRRKTLFSPSLSSRQLKSQKVESALIINAMNKMTSCGMPVSQRVI